MVTPKGVKKFTNLHDFKIPHVYCESICFRQQYSIFVLNVCSSADGTIKKTVGIVVSFLVFCLLLQQEYFTFAGMQHGKSFIPLSQTYSGKKIRLIILLWELNKFEIPGGWTPILTSLHPNMAIKVYDVKNRKVLRSNMSFFIGNNVCSSKLINVTQDLHENGKKDNLLTQCY